MTPLARIAPSVAVWATLMAAGCDCRSGESAGLAPTVSNDTGPGLPGSSADDLPLVSLEDLEAGQRQAVEGIIDILEEHYPAWNPDHQSLYDFHEGWYESREIQRFMAIIDRAKNDPAWPALFDDAQRTFGGEYMVLRGSPPGFYVPSFIIVIARKRPRNITAVFRLSMLAPLWDYYEILRDSEGDFVALKLSAQSDETAAITRQMRGLMAEHYPHYRELSPELGSVLVPHLKAENTRLGNTSVAELLFCDVRNW